MGCIVVVKMKALFRCLSSAPPSLLLGLAVSAAYGQNDPEVSKDAGRLRCEGLLLVTGNSSASHAVSANFLPGLELAQLQKRFPADQYRIVKGGPTGLMLFDLRSGPLGYAKAQSEVLGVLQKRISRDGIVDMTMLSPEETEAFRRVRKGVAIDNATQQPLEVKELGLVSYLDVKYESGGVSKSARLFAAGPLAERTTNALKQAFRENPPRPMKNVDPASLVTSTDRQSLSISWIGSGTRDWPSAGRAVAAALATMQSDLLKRDAEIANDLLKRLGYETKHLPEGAVSPEELGDEVWSRVKGGILDSWRTSGFGSREEAEAFLTGCSSVRFSMSLGLRQILSPGDPARKVPGKIADNIIREDLPGAISP